MLFSIRFGQERDIVFLHRFHEPFGHVLPTVRKCVFRNFGGEILMKLSSKQGSKLF